jgi:hypothetical protein
MAAPIPVRGSEKFMNGLSHIQTAVEPQKEKFPLGLIEAGACSKGHYAGAQLLRLEGNSSCPELWEKAQDLFEEARAEMSPLEHHRKLMTAGMAFTQVVLATGHHPVEKSFALNNLGLIMQAVNQMELALRAFGFALTINPEHPTILQNFGTAKMVLGDLPGANDFFLKALEKDPKCAEARWNSALIALLFGDFRRGFINYEWRWKCGTFTWREFKSHKPKWKGQDLRGKTILLTHEQGIGDSIMFIRYAKMVKARGAAKVRYLTLPELECVLTPQTVEGVDEVTVFRDENRDGSLPDHEFDYHCPLLSLPKIFKTRVETVPWGVYVKCVSVNRNVTEIIGERREKKRVGIVWAGRKEHANDKNRSMRIEDFAPLFDVPGVNWYSLQFGPRASDAENFKNIYSPPLKTFADTAWWLNELDLLISVDTSVVHLAGAMGYPVWTLLPTSGDWRWMVDREDSPWYPTMRLWRQKIKGDWAEVIERVRKELIGPSNTSAS